MTNQAPNRPTTREAVYDVIDGEREYQQKHFPASPEPSITDFAALIDEYAIKLAAPFTPSPGLSPAEVVAAEKVAVAKRFREIAAIAVHAMEVYGAAPRDNHVPASAGITGTLNATAKVDFLAPKPTAAPTEAAPVVAHDPSAVHVQDSSHVQIGERNLQGVHAEGNVHEHRPDASVAHEQKK